MPTQTLLAGGRRGSKGPVFRRPQAPRTTYRSSYPQDAEWLSVNDGQSHCYADTEAGPANPDDPQREIDLAGDCAFAWLANQRAVEHDDARLAGELQDALNMPGVRGL
jgi:hypothetical protein